MTWNELTCNKATQLYDAPIGHTRQRHEYTSYWLQAAGRLVLGQFWAHVFQCDCWHWRSVQFVCCKQALTGIKSGWTALNQLQFVD